MFSLGGDKVVDITIRLLTEDEIYELTYDRENSSIKLDNHREHGSDRFSNFSIFSPGTSFLERSNKNYLTAFNSKDDIVGVLKYGEYGYSNKHQAVSYLDIHKGFKRNGIAKQLISELNNHVCSKSTLYISEETEEGERAGVLELFKRLITVTKCVSTRERCIL